MSFEDASASFKVLCRGKANVFATYSHAKVTEKGIREKAKKKKAIR